MNYNKKTIGRIMQDCNACRNNFTVWLATLNFGKDKEENIRHHFYNHCPSCKALNKLKKS